MHRESLHDTISRLMRMMSHAEGASFPLHTDSLKLRGDCLHQSPRARDSWVASTSSVVTTGDTPRSVSPDSIPKQCAMLHVVSSLLQPTFQPVFTFLSLKSQKKRKNIFIYIDQNIGFFLSSDSNGKENILKLKP